MDRILKLPNSMNVRDLGGYPAQGRVTRWKSVLRGDNPNRLTPESVQALLDYGLRTVIDLRHPSEANDPTNPFVPGGLGAAAGVILHSLPLFEVEAYEATPALKAGPHSSTWSIAMLETFGVNIARVMRAIAQAPEGAVLFHCHLGKDRTGLVGQLLLAALGVDEDVVLEVVASLPVAALRVDPETIELHFALGNLFRRRGELDLSRRRICQT
jgi:protein-tyrosine phosphatase